MSGYILKSAFPSAPETRNGECLCGLEECLGDIAPIQIDQEHMKTKIAGTPLFQNRDLGHLRLTLIWPGYRAPGHSDPCGPCAHNGD